jgi:hypothetical protein
MMLFSEIGMKHLRLFLFIQCIKHEYNISRKSQGSGWVEKKSETPKRSRLTKQFKTAKFFYDGLVSFFYKESSVIPGSITFN